jgi:hypothetical protein
MKINGKEIRGLNIEEIVIPRGNDDAIILRAEAVSSFDEFDALCPRPKPRRGRNRQNEMVELTQEPDYLKAISEYGNQRVAYMIIKSLTATETLEWETVDLSKPETWKNYVKELTSSGFSDGEVARIITGVMSASGLDEAKVEAARNRFLRSQQEGSETRFYQKDARSSMPSGQLASDSE